MSNTRNILEDFWYGNLESAEYDTSPSPEYKKPLPLISRNEEKLLATTTDAQKDWFSRYQDCVWEFQSIGRVSVIPKEFPTWY